MNRSIKMIKKFVLAFITPVTMFAAGDNIVLERNPDGTLKRFTKKEFMEKPKDYRRAYAQEVIMMQTGGIITKKDSGKGTFLFVNGSKHVTIEAIKTAISPIRKFTRINVEIKEGRNVTPLNAKKEIENSGANACIFLVESNELPRLLLAPEEGWGMVNVSALNTDSPSKDKLALRVRKEIVRAFTFVCGSVNDIRNGITMRPVASLADIDSIPGDRFAPSNMKAMEEQLQLLGIRPIITATYRKACVEGWAPAPTNEYQKAIWDRVHAAPKNPMKIEFDPKKGR